MSVVTQSPRGSGCDRQLHDRHVHPGTLTVIAAPLTVTATNESMVFGGPVPALTYAYTGLVNKDTSATFSRSLATTATSSSNVGAYPIAQGTLAATGNYTINTINPGTLTVIAAPLTVTATNESVRILLGGTTLLPYGAITHIKLFDKLGGR